MNKIQEFFWFAWPDRRFLESSYALGDLAVELNSLNERRGVLQREYKNLKQSSNCAECKGRCCTDEFAPYYSGIDALLRMFSDRPVREIHRWKARPLGTVLLERIRPNGKSPTGASAAAQVSWCANLGPEGCLLAAEDRPMRCILYICPEARRSLPGEVLQRMGAINMELSALSVQALKGLRRRSRLLT
jgi:hypothetical protein